MADTTTKSFPAGVRAVQQVLGGLGGIPKKRTTDLPLGAVSYSPGLDVETLILADRLNDVVTDAPELGAVLTKVRAIINGPDTCATAEDVARLARQVRETNLWLFRASSAIHSDAANARANWIPIPKDPITTYAWTGKGKHADVVAKAWVGGPVDAAWKAAEAWDEGFPDQVVKTFLYHPAALQGHIGVIGQQYAALAALRGTSSNLTDKGYRWIGIGDFVVQPDGSNKWRMHTELEQQLGAYQSQLDSPARRRAASADVMKFNMLVQRISATLNALALDYEVTYWADNLWPVGNDDLIGIMKLYHLELTGIINELDLSFTPATRQWQATGMAELVDLTSPPGFTTACNNAQSKVNLENWIETVAIVVAVGAAATLSGGAAGALAGEVLAVAGAEGLGVTLGTIAVEAVAVTLVSRSLNELVYGEAAVRGTSFWEELATNAFMAGAGRIVSAGLGQALNKAVAEGAADVKAGFNAKLFAAEQITLFGIGVVLGRLQSGAYPSLGSLGTSLVEQVLMSGTIHLAGKLGEKFSERNPAVAGKADPAMTQQLDRGAADLAAMVDKELKGTATPADQQVLVAKTEKQFNDEVAVIRSLPEADADRVAALEAMNQLAGETMFLLAVAGFDPALSPASEPATFGPAGSGSVSYTEDGPGILNKLAADKNGSVTYLSDAADVLKVTTPNGPTVYAVPAPDVYVNSPAAQRVIFGREAAAHAVATSDLAAVGDTNLKSLFGDNTIGEIYRQVGPEQVGALLECLAHPYFASAARGSVSAGDIIALGNSENARSFVTLISPELAIKIRRSAGRSGNFYNEATHAMLAKASTLIGDGQATADQLIGLKKKQLDTLLRPVKEKPYRRATRNAGNSGIDIESDAFKASFRRRVVEAAAKGQVFADNDDALKVLTARASVDQVRAAVELSVFKKMVWESQTTILNTLDGHCQAARWTGEDAKAPPTKGSVLISNNHHGFVVERMLLDRLPPGKKIIFVDGGRPAGPADQGVLIPDWSNRENGRWEVWDIKSDRIDLLSLAGDGTAAIKEYAQKYAEALGPKQVTPDGPKGGQLDPQSRVTIWFREVPTNPAVRAAIMNEAARLLGEGFHQIKFGQEAPLTINKMP